MDKKKDGIGVADGARDGQRERERHSTKTKSTMCEFLPIYFFSI